MTFRYVQASGHMYANDALIGEGYAGRLAGRNNPEMQNVKDTGPLPCGRYLFGGVDQSKGPNTVHLIPDPRNQMFGRVGFLIHGDNQDHDASHGCIILGPLIRKRIIKDMADGARLEVVATETPLFAEGAVS